MEYSLLSDNSLVNLFKNSDGLAFKEIYTRYWKNIYKMPTQKFTGKN